MGDWGGAPGSTGYAAPAAGRDPGAGDGATRRGHPRPPPGGADERPRRRKRRGRRPGPARPAGQPDEADDAQFALDNAIFTAVLDAANECLGQFDARPSDERWCDALLQLIQLAQVASGHAGPGQPG